MTYRLFKNSTTHEQISWKAFWNTVKSVVLLLPAFDAPRLCSTKGRISTFACTCTIWHTIIIKITIFRFPPRDESSPLHWANTSSSKRIYNTELLLPLNAYRRKKNLRRKFYLNPRSLEKMFPSSFQGEKLGYLYILFLSMNTLSEYLVLLQFRRNEK